jgi:hypothetical protein
MINPPKSCSYPYNLRNSAAGSSTDDPLLKRRPRTLSCQRKDLLRQTRIALLEKNNPCRNRPLPPMRGTPFMPGTPSLSRSFHTLAAQITAN